ncbi:MAG TPA: DUF4870 domain-containing protein [Terracidiphilus sp.]|nr:DUF4870 domain-containing protein [Terracidiphilus sp.]
MSDSQQVPPVPAQSGLSDTAAGALAYVTIIPAIIFLLVEPYNRNPFVKFHAWQNIFFFIVCIALGVVDMMLAFIPILGFLLILAIGASLIAIWITCVIKALNGQKFMLPIIGPLAEKQANS